MCIRDRGYIERRGDGIEQPVCNYVWNNVAGQGPTRSLTLFHSDRRDNATTTNNNNKVIKPTFDV